MHPVRRAGALFFCLGAAVLAAIYLGPQWLPIPRFLVIAGPACVLLGGTMVAHPGPLPAEGFDFEDFYDEASIGSKILYSAMGLCGAGLGLCLYLYQSAWLTQLLE